MRKLVNINTNKHQQIHSHNEPTTRNAIDRDDKRGKILATIRGNILLSILPAFSKILEKVIATKLIKYLDFNKLFYEHQYGFRPKHNTTHPIIHLLNQIAMSNDKDTKELTLSVFIDLSKRSILYIYLYSYNHVHIL